MISALIGAGLSAMGGVIKNANAQKNAERNADIAWERQNEMYDIMHKDNSPLQRVKDLEGAGLSKSLMFGGGAGSVGGQGIGASAPKADTVPLENPLQGLGLTIAQIKNIEADTEGKQISNINNKVDGVDYGQKVQETKTSQAEEGKKIEETRRIKLEGDIAEINKRIAGATETNEIERLIEERNKVTKEIENIGKDTEKKGEEIVNIEKDTEKKGAEIENLRKQGKEIDSRIDLNEALTDQADSMYWLNKTQQKKMISDVAIAFKRLELDYTKLTEVEKTKLEIELKKLDWTKEIDSLELQQRIKENVMNYGQKK